MCGDPCPPCAEPCTNQCMHRQCAMTCGEKCDVEPCNEPCHRELPCSPKGGLNEGQEGPLPEPHYCIGVCGEDCIEDICRICNPDKFEELRQILEDLLNYEQKENELFLRLKDCGHIFEVQGLDKWINESHLSGHTTDDGSRAIVVIRCPRCTTPIKRSKRYISLLNERAGEIEQIKRKLQGHRSKQILDEQWHNFKETKLDGKQFVHLNGRITTEQEHLIAVMNSDWKQIMWKLRNIKDSEITAQWIETAGNIQRILTGFDEALARINQCPFLGVIIMGKPSTGSLSSMRLNTALAVIIGVLKQQSLREFLLEDLASLLHSLAERKLRTIAATSLEQLASELGRHNFLFNVFKWAAIMIKKRRTTVVVDMEGTNMLKALLTKVATHREPFAQQREDFEKEFKALIAHINMPGMDGISAGEFVQIKRALGSRLGKWYKCPNGHLYNIDRCGRPMEESQCPDCNVAIGGGRHRLLDTNAEAHQLNAEFREALRNDFRAYW